MQINPVVVNATLSPCMTTIRRNTHVISGNSRVLRLVEVPVEIQQVFLQWDLPNSMKVHALSSPTRVKSAARIEFNVGVLNQQMGANEK